MHLDFRGQQYREQQARHQLTAALLTKAQSLPGVREAIEQKHYDEAESELVRVARALDRETALVSAAAADLEKIR